MSTTRLYLSDIGFSGVSTGTRHDSVSLATGHDLAGGSPPYRDLSQNPGNSTARIQGAVSGAGAPHYGYFGKFASPGLGYNLLDGGGLAVPACTMKVYLDLYQNDLAVNLKPRLFIYGICGAGVDSPKPIIGLESPIESSVEAETSYGILKEYFNVPFGGYSGDAGEEGYDTISAELLFKCDNSDSGAHTVGLQYGGAIGSGSESYIELTTDDITWKSFRTARLFWVEFEAPGAPEQVSISDAGSGNEAAQLAATLSQNDAGSGTDELDLLALLNVSDTATAPEFVSALATLGISDAAVGLEGYDVLATLSAADLGAGNESLLLALALVAADTGTGTEQLVILDIDITEFSVSDSGAGAVNASVLATIDLSETLTGTELVSKINQSIANRVHGGLGINRSASNLGVSR